MAETSVPSIRVTANARDSNASVGSPKRPSAATRGSFGSSSKPSDTNEGIYVSAAWLTADEAPPSYCFADPLRVARPLSNGKTYPSKLLPAFSSGPNSARNSMSDGRRESQPIDPLSHVRYG